MSSGSRQSCRKCGALGAMGLVCACLTVLLPLLAAVLSDRSGSALQVWVVKPLSTSLPWIIPLLWIGGVVLGILAVYRGDGRHGAEAVVICGVELCSVVGAVVGAVALALLARREVSGPETMGLAMMGVMVFGLIGFVVGGLIGVVISLCVVAWMRRRAARRQRRPVDRNGHRPDNAMGNELEQHRRAGVQTRRPAPPPPRIEEASVQLCPACGKRNRENRTFCWSCSADLRPLREDATAGESGGGALTSA